MGASVSPSCCVPFPGHLRRLYLPPPSLPPRPGFQWSWTWWVCRHGYPVPCLGFMPDHPASSNTAAFYLLLPYETVSSVRTGFCCLGSLLCSQPLAHCLGQSAVPYMRRMMDGWMDGWIHGNRCFCQWACYWQAMGGTMNKPWQSFMPFLNLRKYFDMYYKNKSVPVTGRTLSLFLDFKSHQGKICSPQFSHCFCN